jgi:hypothetical protein
VIVVGPGIRERAADAGGAADAIAAALAEVERLVGTGTPRGEAARRVSLATGIPRRRLYAVPPSD